MIDARGRNGWFKVNDVDVWKTSDMAPHFPSEITVYVFSRQHGDTPPVLFRGTPKEMKQLFGGILAAIEKEGGKIVLEGEEYVSGK